MASIMRRQDPKVGDAVFVGRFQKARYGIPDAGQKVMEGFGFVVRMFQPSVCYHPSKDLFGRCGARGLCCAQEVKNSVAFRQLSPEVRVGEILDHEG